MAQQGVEAVVSSILEFGFDADQIARQVLPLSCRLY